MDIKTVRVLEYISEQQYIYGEFDDFRYLDKSNASEELKQELKSKYNSDTDIINKLAVPYWKECRENGWIY